MLSGAGSIVKKIPTLLFPSPVEFTPLTLQYNLDPSGKLLALNVVSTILSADSKVDRNNRFLAISIVYVSDLDSFFHLNS